MKIVSYSAIALACALCLTACGGGGADGQPSAQQTDNPSRVQAASIVAQTSSDVILTVALSGSSSNTITVKNSYGFIVNLYKNDGTTKITSIDDLPEGIANYTWTKTATSAGNLRIRFTPGNYRFTKGWSWPVAASGHDATHQIVLEQTPGTSGEVAFLGSIASSASYASGASTVTATTTAGTAAFEQLWAEGSRAIRARYPNTGRFLYVRGAAQGWPTSATDPTVVGTLGGTNVNKQAFQADTDGYTQLSAIKAANDTNAVVVLMDGWQVGKHRVVDVDSTGQRVRISPNTSWEIGSQGNSQRYFIENRLSLLDAPSEWYWSGSTLTYKPITANTSGTTKTINFEIPQVEKLLTMNGAVDSGKWLQYVQFSGLKFRYTKVNMPAAGYIDQYGQADVVVSAAIELNDARYVEFVNCEVSHTGGYGIWLNKRTQSVRVDSSELYDLGAGGVKIGKIPVDAEAAADRADPNATSYNIINSSRIHSTGHVYPGAIGVWVGRSSHNTISNSLIKDTTYSAISVGWNWDASTPSNASDNWVQNNFLYNIGQYALADLGGVYTLGRSTGTWIASNVIKEVHAYGAYGAPARALYADQGSSDLIIYHNLVYGTEGVGVFSSSGENNQLAYNDLVNVGQGFGILNRLAGSTLEPAILTGNRFFPRSNDIIGLSLDTTLMTGSTLATAQWVPTVPTFSSSNNNTVSAQFLPAGTTLTIPALCTNCLANTSTTVTNPGPLLVPTFNDGTDYSSQPTWSASMLSSTISAARLWDGHVDTTAPSKVIDFRANQWPLASPASVRDLPVYMAIAQATPAVSIQKDGSGTPYLALTDATRSTNAWEPYIQATPNYASGTAATVRIRVKFDAQTNLTQEWRSDDNGLQVGPKVGFVANGSGKVDIYVNGVVLSASQQVDVGTWNTFEVKATLGASTFTLSKNGTLIGTYGVTSTGNWGALKYLVFHSDANVATTTAFTDIWVDNH